MQSGQVSLQGRGTCRRRSGYGAQAAFIAHRIKGAAANLSAVQLSESARRIEMAAKAGERDKLPALLQELLAELARTAATLSAGV